MNLTRQIKDIDLAALVENEGVKLRNGMGICPLPDHHDQHPSFKVYTDNRFKCFGCGRYGDAIDLLQELHGLTFSEALQRAGINQGPATTDMRKRIAEAERRREQKEQRQQYESDLVFTLGVLIREGHKAMAGIKTIEDMENAAEVVDRLHWWEYCHDMLIHGTDDEKQKCLEDLKDMQTKKRDRIFRPDFDFSEWLRKFIANGTVRPANQ